MAFKRKDTTSKEVFCLTLPLRHAPWQRDRLDTIFFCCNNIKNAFIARELRALKELEKTNKWKALERLIFDNWKLIQALSKVPENEPSEQKIEREKRLVAAREMKCRYTEQRTHMLSAAGFTRFSFQAKIKDMRKHYSKHVSAVIAQKIADSVWFSFHSYFWKNGEDIYFSKISEFDSIEGKSNATGIRYANGHLFVGKELRIPVATSRCDRYAYEEQALQREVHYCRIIRKAYPEGWRYFVQLVLAGEPPHKINRDTGEPIRTLGCGRVGNDIGPQTLATVSDSSVQLRVLCDGAQDIQDELRRVNRALDRSRRVCNPLMFKENGTVVDIDDLPDECVSTIRGRKRRKWVKSKHYYRLERYRRYLYRKQRECRIQSHNELANKLAALGDDHYVEDMNWKALAKRSKKTEKSEKTGKFKRKKRFGKSIANKAPAMLVNKYEERVLRLGGSFHRVDPKNLKASQYDHESHTYKKKNLSKRWHQTASGILVQRDIYSAYLLQNVAEDLKSYNDEALNEKFEVFKQLHDAEIQRLQMTKTPSSTGVRCIA